MNHSDSERIRSVIEKVGFTMIENESEADLIGVIACSVRQKAIDKVYSKINKWNKWKKDKPLITFVSGCILPNDELKFLKLFDLLFRMNQLPDLPKMLSDFGVVTPYSVSNLLPVVEKVNDLTDFWQVKPSYTKKFEAFIPIQNGCDKMCSFCAVPYTRGKEVSRASSDILDEIRYLVSKNIKSITLLGQNVNSYGLDNPENELSFASLLDEIGKIGIKSGKFFWVYFTSPHPRDMTKDVLEVISSYQCLAKQIHLPLQSGDDKLLRRMNRNHNVHDYLNIIKDIKKILPSSTIFTDIIVGFCGETDEQFFNTADIMLNAKFNMAYIAKYSPRIGARSARWDDDVSSDKKSERFSILSEILKRTSFQHNQTLVGKKMKVLVERVDPRMNSSVSARTEGKLPVRISNTSDKIVGTFQDVKIISASELSLTGELVKNPIKELVN